VKSGKGRRRSGLETLRDLEQGNLSPGEKHLAEFLRSVQGGYRISSGTIKFLKLAIQRLFAGEPPAKAFKLNSKRGARGVPAAVSDQVAREIWAERRIGATYDEAVVVVASRHRLSRNTVKAYYSKSKQTGGVPPPAQSQWLLYPVNPIERQKFLEGRKKSP
jgi:hypothetical protein